MSAEGRRAAIFAVSPDAAGIRGWFVRISRRRYGLAPGIMRVLLTDLPVGILASLLYDRVNFGARSVGALHREMVATVVNGKIGGAPWLGLHSAAVRRLMGTEHRDREFATTWREYALDLKTRALLEYAEKLTGEPSVINDADVDALATAGWDDAGIREITRLIAFYNFSGRLEAASGLPQDEPDDRGLDRFVGPLKSRGR